jgi:Zn finger protein HypA/HybF involved in hydrogenase expression
MKRNMEIRNAIKWKLLKSIQWKLTDLVQYIIPRTFTCEHCKTKYSVWDRAIVYPFCPSCKGWSKENKQNVKAHYQHN